MFKPNLNIKHREYWPLWFYFSVLLPGGAVSIYDSPYERTGKTLFNLAKQANDAGDIFPIWGTCLGFELLCQLVANDKHVMSSVDGVDFSVPLNFSEGWCCNVFQRFKSYCTPSLHPTSAYLKSFRPQLVIFSKSASVSGSVYLRVFVLHTYLNCQKMTQTLFK